MAASQTITVKNYYVVSYGKAESQKIVCGGTSFFGHASGKILPINFL